MHKARSNTRDDFDKVKDALQKLRNENRKLRKENAQLRKELHRFDGFTVDPEDIETEEVTFELVDKVSEEKPKCPKCKTDALMQINAGKYVVKFCNVCGYRKRQEV